MFFLFSPKHKFYTEIANANPFFSLCNIHSLFVAQNREGSKLKFIQYIHQFFKPTQNQGMKVEV